MDTTNSILTEVESIGIGITNACNLNCKHCYSRNMSISNLSLEDLAAILDQMPKLKAVNFGTGESILNESFLDIVSLLKSREIKMALTSNGTSVMALSDDQLRQIDEFDISIDFPDAKKHDEFRGFIGAYDRAIASVERLRNLGKDVSIACALTSSNCQDIRGFRALTKKYNIPLRINIYKPVKNDDYTLSYDQFWDSMKLISKTFKLIAMSEPILSIVTDTVVEGSPCGNSVRLHPDKSITGCVYLDGNQYTVESFQSNKKIIPKFCKKCDYVNKCRGGCFGRRILENREGLPDSYCPFYLNKPKPEISFEKSLESNHDYIHAKYLCTMIVI